MNKKSSQGMVNEHIESNINTIEDQFEKNNESKTVSLNFLETKLTPKSILE